MDLGDQSLLISPTSGVLFSCYTKVTLFRTDPSLSTLKILINATTSAFFFPLSSYVTSLLEVSLNTVRRVDAFLATLTKTGSISTLFTYEGRHLNLSQMPTAYFLIFSSPKTISSLISHLNLSDLFLGKPI